jgi:ATP-dependent Lon protease
VVGFEGFIEEIKRHLKIANATREGGKKIIPSQRFYLLLGRPGIGKSYIAGKIAEYLGKQFININCSNANLTEIVGITPEYKSANFGKIVKGMSDKQDRSPLILLDEVDKCSEQRGEGLIGTISILFDDTKNKTDFDDKFLGSSIPMNEAFFVCTANNIKNLPDFILSRCNRVNIGLLT